jgi:hypothetical protein
MAMSYSERMRYIMEENNKFVARNKVRDSSELTLIRQAKATSTVAPQTVPAVINLHTSQQMTSYQELPDCPATVVFTGVGNYNDYSAILQKAQGCAVCSDNDTVVNPYITLPTPCFNRSGFPFVQSNVSSPVVCKTIGNTGYFPQGPSCAASNNIYYTPSYN